MGWWSDVLADAIMRSGRMKIAACYSRSRDKREAFAAKYACTARELRSDPRRPPHRGDHQHHAELGAPRDHVRRGGRGQARVPRQADRQHHRRRARHHRGVPQAKVVLALGYQRRRESQFRWIKADLGKFGKLVNAEPTSAATGSARSTSARGATPPRACRAA
jgi:hypothetical protein